MNAKSKVKVLHKDGVIEMNKIFAKMIENPFSEEYEFLQKIRMDYPKYTVGVREIKKNPNKECWKGLTYEYMMQLQYGVEVQDRTLRSWCSKLIRNNLLQKCGRVTCWKTQRFGKEKYRTPVAADDPEMEEYFQKKREYLDVAMIAAETAGKIGKEAVADAWNSTYKALWQQFGCCYYTCKGLLFNAVGEDYVFEIYELAQEIAATPVIIHTDPKNITCKEEYYETWFNHHHI